jgi:hypothetical protein
MSFDTIGKKSWEKYIADGNAVRVTGIPFGNWAEARLARLDSGDENCGVERVAGVYILTMESRYRIIMIMSIPEDSWSCRSSANREM